MDPGDGDGERKPSRPLTVPLAFTQLISLLAWYFLPSFLFPIDPGPYLPVYSPPGVIALDGLCVGKKEDRLFKQLIPLPRINSLIASSSTASYQLL